MASVQMVHSSVGHVKRLHEEWGNRGEQEKPETGVRGQGHDKMTMRRVAGIGEMEGKGKGKTRKGNRVGVRVREGKRGIVKAKRKRKKNKLVE